MNTDSANDWEPLSRAQFEDILNEEVAQLPADTLAMYDTYGIGIEERPCYRSEPYGVERVFVVARAGEQLLLLDDVEDEFSIGAPDSDGVLRHWGLCGTLNTAIRLLQSVPK